MDDAKPRHQLHTQTFRGRHTDLMQEIASRLVLANSPRILSFGCSTGAECQDFAEIFPNAEIIGVDVNIKALAKANLINDFRIKFMHSTEENILSGAPYDIVFAMNVLCRYPSTEGLDNISEIYPFYMFDEMIHDLDRYLKPGGVLGMYNCQYFFDDTKVYSKYAPLMHGVNLHSGWMERYRPDGKRATSIYTTYEGKEYSREEWRALKAVSPDLRKDSARHEWVASEIYSGRHTDVSLWIKQA
ncbi:class I SAM-dependent methyltransferase [Asticcacaulis sp. AC460]|uniref:class I SAM-dependent methyltransferase n=1 Tax=Asticcacaulis sp. AC460 TaxID=1282360 RepID=UPI0009DECC91|nr:class I SAM-dependent methyltransferase [Asticcacaulis sp. AC460]